jgi:hypothetical protein
MALVPLCWEGAGVFVVLGSPWAVIFDLTTGVVRQNFSVEFVGKASLDIAVLGLGTGGHLLLIASTKRVWVIDDTLTPVLRYEPRYLLSGASLMCADPRTIVCTNCQAQLRVLAVDAGQVIFSSTLPERMRKHQRRTCCTVCAERLSLPIVEFLGQK